HTGGRGFKSRQPRSQLEGWMPRPRPLDARGRSFRGSLVMTTGHVPVLLDEVTRLARGVERAVDATVGAGGHAGALLDAGVMLLAIDRDPEALATARARLAGARVEFLRGSFAEGPILDAIMRFAPQLVLLDLGVSSLQLDSPQRGFSFRPGTPLDMRMTREGPTAADLLNDLPAQQLARMFEAFGDERHAKRLARAVVRRRSKVPFSTSDDLVDAIREVLGTRAGPAQFARLFQAVRIAVNRELDELRCALPRLRDALQPGGRLVVISYHSGEDRIVKREFRDWARSCVCPSGQPLCTCRGLPLGAVDPRRPVVPTAAEIAANPRARSAKLRGFVKSAAR
ncbi:MAG: 16S rRNA (cytosine(1402)-N(4))-methyltransferase RsmH, partial [Gemmatimonadales bacterium]